MDKQAPLSIVVLAAGQGTRMRSRLPKVLHPIGGKPMLAHVLETALALEPAATYIVHGHSGERVREALANPGAGAVNWIEQAEQLGTGHAVDQAMAGVPDTHTVLVLYGDVPLISVSTLQHLVAASRGALGLLVAHLENPAGYGRIVRNENGAVLHIVEDQDASALERRIKEGNTGMLAVNAAQLRRWLAALGNDNAQGEYYLTDIIAMAVAQGVPVNTVYPDGLDEILGVNNKRQLAQVERDYQRRQALVLLAAGVSLCDPQRIDVRGQLQTGLDVSIDVNVVFEGRVVLGDDVRIGAHCVIRDAEIGDGCEILPMCVIEGAVIAAGSRIGPFARLRPGTRLAPHTHVGNFVEIKNTNVGEGSKINHLSYVGDADVGREVNIGAGSITCNYDGANKHRTVIGDRAFIGSDTQLIAPVSVGDDATIGAGSTITRDTPAGALTLSRAKQETREGWKRPRKNK